jgi:hypothetical protein
MSDVEKTVHSTICVLANGIISSSELILVVL